MDADEPQQTVSFVPERRMSHSFLADDAAEREVASFSLGKGRADWGPLTVYALMKSGDIYAVCPYMPKNAYVMSLASPDVTDGGIAARSRPRTSMRSNATLLPNKSFYLIRQVAEIPHHQTTSRRCTTTSTNTSAP